jgi:large subunit ribosomal protein L9
MATTSILLKEDVDNLGNRGEIVKVKAGYARNYLIPRKLAVQANAGNVKQIEQERAALLKKEAKDLAGARERAGMIEKIRLTFNRKVGEHGILYGSVTTMDITEALKEKGFEIDRRRVSLDDSIKETGDFVARVKLHREVIASVPVSVVAEGESGTAS